MGAIGYPFALLARRPLAMIGAFVILFAAFVVTDFGFAAAGVDYQLDRGASALNNLISGVINLIGSAYVMGLGMVDLKRRDQPPSAADAALFFVLNLKFGFMVVLPLGVVTMVLIGVAAFIARPETPGDFGPSGPIMLAVLFVTGLVFLFFLFKLYLAWPMALNDSRPRLWRAWGLSKGKFWLIAGVVTVSYIVGLAPFFIVGIVLHAIGMIPQGPVDSVTAALRPTALVYSLVLNALTTFMLVYTTPVAAHLYDQIGPQKVSVADEF